MGVEFKIDGIMILTGLVVVAGVAVYVKKEKIKEALNPASDQNAIYTALNESLADATGRKDLTLGKAIYETKTYNPIAWLFEGIGTVTGQLP